MVYSREKEGGRFMKNEEKGYRCNGGMETGRMRGIRIYVCPPSTPATVRYS